MIPEQFEELMSMLRSIERLLRQQNNTKPYRKKETWITAMEVKKLTGWSSNKMVKARKLDWVKHKPSATGGYVYLLESIPENYILSNNVA